MKESYNIQQFNIYWILENFLEKMIFRNLYSLNLKWLLWDFSLRPWEYGQFVVKNWNLHQRHAWLSFIWWPHQNGSSICIYICISETDSKCYLQKRKVTLKLYLQTSRRPLGERFFLNILELLKVGAYFHHQ